MGLRAKTILGKTSFLNRKCQILQPSLRVPTLERLCANNLEAKTVVTTPTGAYLEPPKKVQFGMVGVTFTVIIGLAIGAFISKSLASFLEENELFVPSDDDDD
ncbi:unnamed protein product [Darwinula stevensoni]|uniref:Essential MCU regulator, mitochondrial n=1 Tax=Darwinula stevensoni TaxID=69355 RepID=A0A7R8X6J9_9CRUS|nr:unnamed protein product [Darwinula stevensoni]CAG0888243.1 unnamed protein product [Darwinula stevensoni]